MNDSSDVRDASPKTSDESPESGGWCYTSRTVAWQGGCPRLESPACGSPHAHRPCHILKSGHKSLSWSGSCSLMAQCHCWRRCPAPNRRCPRNNVNAQLAARALPQRGILHLWCSSRRVAWASWIILIIALSLEGALQVLQNHPSLRGPDLEGFWIFSLAMSSLARRALSTKLPPVLCSLNGKLRKPVDVN